MVRGSAAGRRSKLVAILSRPMIAAVVRFRRVYTFLLCFGDPLVNLPFQPLHRGARVDQQLVSFGFILGQH